MIEHAVATAARQRRPAPSEPRRWPPRPLRCYCRPVAQRSDRKGRAAGAAAAQPRRPKRALTQVGGAAARSGHAGWAQALARCLAVRPTAGLERWTHGFHTYPARMHPDTAAGLVGLLVAPGQTLLDPFCGGGTVLLEALVAGRRALGRDLNPLAVRVAALRCRATSETERRALRDHASRIALQALRRARLDHEPAPLAAALLAPLDAGPTAAPSAVARAPWRGPLATFFPPALLPELAWITSGVAQLDDPFVREALALVLSSLLVKLSHRISDTDARIEERRGVTLGSAARAFRARAHELSMQLKSLAGTLRPRGSAGREGGPGAGERAAPVALGVDDARVLASVPDASVDAVITSPPYPSIYDYAEQHVLRLRWLGLDDTPLVQGEIGARRSFVDPRAGRAQWLRDGEAWVRSLARVLRPGGRAAVLGGDGASTLGPIAFEVDFAAWAKRAGLVRLASASQARRSFDAASRAAYRGGTRREHLLLVGRPA